jgi:AcrR family transcriptional regulator
MGMSIPYERTGRTRQKSRTREALLTAARALVAEGASPTVEDAAARAEISRTTAYRYFPNQRSLLVAAHPEIDRGSLLPAEAPRDPAARLDAVLREFHRIVLDTEPQLRMALRLSLDPAAETRDLTLRGGRAIGWIEEALAPLLGHLSRREVHRLALAIRSAVGIEALVWLTDVGGLARADAIVLMQSSARSLLQAASAGRKRKIPAKRR